MFDEYRFGASTVSAPTVTSCTEMGDGPPSKRVCASPPNEEEITLFRSVFGKAPRDVQVGIFDYLKACVSAETPFILEMPTGGGKSLSGAFAGVLACQKKCRRIVYVTSSKTLQRQVSKEGSMWNMPNKGRHLVCQYGKNNYYCPIRVAHLLNVADSHDRSIFGLVKKSATKARQVMDYLQQMLRVHLKACPDEWWFTPRSEVFEKDLHSRGIDREAIAALWKEITIVAESDSKCHLCTDGTHRCKCACWKSAARNASMDDDIYTRDMKMLETLQCPFHFMKIQAKYSKVWVMNMDVLFSHMSRVVNDGDASVLNTFVLPTDFVIFDEAHMLTKRASELYKTSQIRTFSPSEFLEKATSSGVVTGDLDLTLFSKFDRPRLACVATEIHSDLNKLVAGVDEDTAKTMNAQTKVLVDRLEEAREMCVAANRDITVENVKRACEYLHMDNKAAEICTLFDEKYGEFMKRTGPVIVMSQHVVCSGKCNHAQITAGTVVNFLETRYRAKVDLRACNIDAAIASHKMINLEEDVCGEVSKEVWKYIDIEILARFEASVKETGGDAMSSYYDQLKSRAESPGMESFYQMASTAYDVIVDLGVARSATHKTAMITSSILCNRNIPTIQKDGIAYELTFAEKARLIRKLFEHLPGTCMLMSATLSNPEEPDDTAFDSFFLETGLDKSTQTRRISEVFDSKNLTIYVPHMKKYCYSESYDYKRRYDSERQEWLRKTIALAPKAVLVVGNSLADIDSIFYAMRKVVKGRKHIHYNTDPKAYDEFVSGKKNNVVIYGSEKLYTGMDLPGRVSMVVLLKAFNDVRVITGPYYNIVGDRVFDETGRRVADEYNKLYRYNTCRATIQATGRIMRQHGDQGVVMLLSDNTNDAHMLKQQFKNAPLVRDEMTAWPYGTP